MFLTGDFCFLDNTQRKSLKLSEATVGQFEAVEIPEEKCVEYSHESPDDEDSVSINRFSLWKWIL